MQNPKLIFGWAFFPRGFGGPSNSKKLARSHLSCWADNAMVLIALVRHYRSNPVDTIGAPRQAIAAGIWKIEATSSMAAMFEIETSSGRRRIDIFLPGFLPYLPLPPG